MATTVKKNCKKNSNSELENQRARFTHWPFQPCILPQSQTQLAIFPAIFFYYLNTYVFQIYTKIGKPKGMKESVLASNICGSNPKLTIFAKNGPQN